jgi:hypothetical protein
MPGKNARFTKKQDRQAKHVADSEKKSGKSADEAKRIGFATVNKNKSAKKDAPAKGKEETVAQAKDRRDKAQHRRKRNIGRS